MLEHEPAKDEHADRDEVRGRVVRLLEPGDLGVEELERVAGERFDEEAVFDPNRL